MINSIKYINSWSEFVEIAEKHSAKEGLNPYAFRGQSNSSWKIQNSLQRKLIEMGINNQKDALEFERKLAETFKVCSKKHLKSLRKRIENRDLLSWWELMQHYGAPTRLLDWTASPYIACYFAVSESFEEDAAVYIFDAAHLLWIQSLRANEEKNYENKRCYEQIEKSIKGKDYYECVLTITDPHPTDRMIAQKSEFTLSTELLIDHDVLIDEIVYKNVNNGKGHSLFSKIIINKNLKKKFMIELNKMDINAGNLFPGLDGVGKQINEKIMMGEI
ncbi:MAG: FRG domain-containing protein [Clostridiales bacterium]|nr:FRG domain-containing protein [Clostridiales bacterium]